MLHVCVHVSADSAAVAMQLVAKGTVLAPQHAAVHRGCG